MSARIIHEVISIDPLVVSGTPVFVGTRVPVKTLFDYIQSGYSLNDFYEDFPTVNPDNVQQLLTIVNSLLEEVR